MGVKGLLRYLKPISNAVNIGERYKFRRVGVDMLCLLHRGAMADPTSVMHGDGHLVVGKFVERVLQNLTNAGIDLVCIFDGDALPAKATENNSRKESRQLARDATFEAMKDGASRYEIYGLACKSVSISKTMIDHVVRLCIKNRWAYIVAPYEADSQLAYLCRINYVEAVISEDSDLLAYGCPRLLTKITREGEAIEFDMSGPFGYSDRASLGSKGLCRSQPSKGDTSQQLRSVLNPEFGYLRFLTMCILSNCDYIDETEHVPGMGLSTAAKLLFKHKDLESMLSFIHRDPKWKNKLDNMAISFGELTEAHRRALKTFINHWVFCPLTHAIVPINLSCKHQYNSLPMDMSVLSNPRSRIRAVDEIGNLISNWSAFSGVSLEDKENYDASLLGQCLQRCTTTWLKKTTGGHHELVVASLRNRKQTNHPSAPTITAPASQPSQVTPSQCNTQASVTDVDDLQQWNPNTSQLGGKAKQTKSSFGRRGQNKGNKPSLKPFVKPY